MPSKKTLTAGQTQELLETLRTRFEKHPERHQDVQWDTVEARLKANPSKLWSLYEMERTGGEPDVTGYNKKTGQVVFIDCAPESPSGRRSLLRPRRPGRQESPQAQRLRHGNGCGYGDPTPHRGAVSPPPGIRRI